MAYIMLALAIGCEIGATTALKYSEGFTRLLPTGLSLAGYVVSFFFLSVALKHIPVSTAYAIWSGVGTAVIAAIGFTFLHEELSAVKIGGIALVIGGVVLLNVGGGH
ncbi:QacE family quaternary ammonium compound efflux SMR transporter [Longispora fulva]|uniref:Small multidrug resistance pump n=1 Tax=Longispora fulva TaxID=619741 RepID=A0A8J7GGP7_9ACTN|nr:multidrug efflux SMR transporter [Longispora fulva]MBG6137621.1 small multidrug resistance pump [Longispora fulva]GIG62221.1 QacE family quaternary ammonium compound efflux SMR transporter [Longispora fulva]